MGGADKVCLRATQGCGQGLPEGHTGDKKGVTRSN